MFLLPRNIPVDTVSCRQTCTKHYINAPAACELVTDQFYRALCSKTQRIQPERALFDMDYEPNYHPSFELRLPLDSDLVSISVREEGTRKKTKHTEVWSHELDLTDPLCEIPMTYHGELVLEKLELVRPKFVQNVTGPILDQLLDKLLEEKYLNYEEMETIKVKPRADKARDVVDSVIKKGSRAAEYLMKEYCKKDPKSELCKELQEFMKSNSQVTSVAAGE
ncbi:hypothetical protein NL108_018367 [Boleophthalmus pectinirostris]|nr:hypothetical protein NL108_018367 [Boleophthalmus pectinirostris]